MYIVLLSEILYNISIIKFLLGGNKLYYIWIDESYDSLNVDDPKYLVLGAMVLIDNNDNSVNLAHKNTMNKIRTYNKSKKKIKLNRTELHENDLYKKKLYRIINYFLIELNSIENIYFFSTYKYIKNYKDNTFSLTYNLYMKMVLNLINLINSEFSIKGNSINIYLDMLFKNEARKQYEIISYLLKHIETEIEINFYDSSAVKGLQGADFIAGTVRRFLRNEINGLNNYNIIKNKLILKKEKE